MASLLKEAYPASHRLTSLFCRDAPPQADISHLQHQFQHQPQSASIDQSFEVLGFIRGKVPEPASSPSASGTSLSLPHPGDVEVMEDLVAMGDGGAFMDKVITPVFVVISYEVRD